MSANSGLLLAVLVLAVAAGWWLGFSQQGRGRRWFRKRHLPVTENLAYLLNDQADTAVELFIQSLDVRPDTLEMHLALGTILRRRGEVDRAIRIHQNLLDQSGLDAPQLAMVQLELGRNYAVAGWLDRAERMFEAVLPAGGTFEEVALQELLTLHDSSQDWEKAIQTGDRLLSIHRFHAYKGRDKLSLAMSHYYCELAEQALASGKLAVMRKCLDQASRFCPKSLRIARLQAVMEMESGHADKAFKIVKKHVLAQPSSLPELLDIVERALQSESRPVLLDFLEEGLSREFSVRVMEYLANAMMAEGRHHEALALVVEQVRRYPGLLGVRTLVNLYLPDAEGRAQENLQLLSGLMDRLVHNRAAYQCNDCGFHGQRLHWQCPGCKAWGSVVRIQGVEGD
ncbi:MAG TPA: hypothetical protein VIM96_08160 [Pseudomonadales bacterium]